ncbi:carboxymuconolactone decarboxylase [Actinoplanes sp. NPDC051475]|uniref:carboxymuconolactone decarboxylase family protein n=1 Tax=Actinoplanes sp. NPDC051475 TaxID=3157225 RepID=UPI00344CDD3A
MPHIELPDLPGIVGPLARYPHTGGPLNDLAEALLRAPSPLTPGERETIAAHVSRGNQCTFCTGSHAAVAHLLLEDEGRTPATVESDPKMQALLAIADKVRVDGRTVTAADVEAARKQGADDRTIHDTVLIAAAFCMYNRYVDGLATVAPQRPEAYEEQGRHLAKDGYRLISPA